MFYKAASFCLLDLLQKEGARPRLVVGLVSAQDNLLSSFKSQLDITYHIHRLRLSSL